MDCECKHWTGNQAGQCRAGVKLSEVIDQSRRDQPARFPCLPATAPFTTCARFEVDKEAIRLKAMIGNRIAVKGYKRLDEIYLLALSMDRQSAFVAVNGRKREIAIARIKTPRARR